MSPVIYEDTSVDHRDQFLEASVLHKIPTELLMQSSSSTQYFQSFPNGKTYRRWLLHRRRYAKDERLRKLAKLHIELLGKSVESDSTLERHHDLDATDGKRKEVNDCPMDRNETLLDITLRTMVLLHHNQQLQNKLTALQMETRKFRPSNLKQSTCNFIEQQQKDG